MPVRERACEPVQSAKGATKPERDPSLPLLRALVVLLVVASAGEAQAARVGADDHPFVDPLGATVVRTPQANAIETPALIEGRNLTRH